MQSSHFAVLKGAQTSVTIASCTTFYRNAQIKSIVSGCAGLLLLYPVELFFYSWLCLLVKGGKQGGLHLDHRLPLGTMNDYMPLPGNLNGSCEVLDGSQGSMFCKTEGEQCSNPFMLSNHPQDVFMMDMPGNGCNGRRAYESDGEQCLPHDDKNQILVVRTIVLCSQILTCT